MSLSDHPATSESGISASLRYRLILKAQKVRERLGSGDLGIANPFPVKPTGMHWRRYERLRERHDQALRESIRLLTPSFSKQDS